MNKTGCLMLSSSPGPAITHHPNSRLQMTYEPTVRVPHSRVMIGKAGVRMEKVPFDPQAFLDNYAPKYTSPRDYRWETSSDALDRLSDHYDSLKPEWKLQVGPKLNEWLTSRDKTTREIALEFAETLALPETRWTLRWVRLNSLLMPWRWGNVVQAHSAIQAIKKDEPDGR